MVAEEKPLLNHWVHDPLGMFETSLDPRLLRWVPRPDTCEGPVCITVAEDVVAWTAWAYERAHGRGHWVLGTRADCCLLNGEGAYRAAGYYADDCPIASK
eukprot:CAMPEP_0174372066 /NCGR_PEP_ID=MMETSP0811_2-20130205/102152_1 /TAXON_ID=73025 ORGANISM="Eutreptiella gymnastica-like, Strain CCMP1594" /NCGR_SAMPLE_ID=MMETSP0811_2 /ASSEMBLY_ACC=CAM_ASM_000667 /LENGTH=99 /DNA_ID=CAMNT_0015519087 /DNA_START=582 /DNA_END=882 /DNA_ORIENTATION=+